MAAPVTVTPARPLALGAITTDAGDATSDPLNGSGESGGAVTLKATGVVGAGAISARGGSGRALGGGGAGGAVTITRRPRVDRLDHDARREPERARRRRRRSSLRAD